MRLVLAHKHDKGRLGPERDVGEGPQRALLVEAPALGCAETAQARLPRLVTSHKDDEGARLIVAIDEGPPNQERGVEAKNAASLRTPTTTINEGASPFSFIYTISACGDQHSIGDGRMSKSAMCG